MFKIGDKVRLKTAEKLEQPQWKKQNIGVVTVIRQDKDSIWYTVQWENDREHRYCYHDGDLIKVEEETSKMPTKEQVFEAAQVCPEAKAVLEILFPEYLEETKKEMVAFRRGSYFINRSGAIAELIQVDIDQWHFIHVVDGNRWFPALHAPNKAGCPEITLNEFHAWTKQEEYNWTPIKVDIVVCTK